MALVLKDRINETTTTTGTGTLTLAGATAGFQAFSVIGNSNTTYYCLVDGNNWEVGIGTYSSSGNTLARTTILANYLGTTVAITLGAGTKNVFGVFPADGVVVVNGTTIQVPGNAVLPIANGGTGSNTATFSGANITSINANNISSGVLAVAQGGTGSATATFSGENITSLNASNISTGTLANARTTATSSNGADTIVSRDASGNFSANVITADGSALTSLNATAITAGTIANNRTTASSSNGASTIVQRDASGDFSANIITANSYSGSGASLTSLNASSISSGTLGVARGGTGAATLDANNVILGNGTSAVQFVAPGTSSNVLTSNGTTWVSQAPSGITTGKAIAMSIVFGG